MKEQESISILAPIYYILLNMFITSCMRIVGVYGQNRVFAEIGVLLCQARCSEQLCIVASDDVLYSSPGRVLQACQHINSP
jgi:hypothetical protein